MGVVKWVRLQFKSIEKLSHKTAPPVFALTAAMPGMMLNYIPRESRSRRNVDRSTSIGYNRYVESRIGFVVNMLQSAT